MPCFVQLFAPARIYWLVLPQIGGVKTKGGAAMKYDTLYQQDVDDLIYQEEWQVSQR